MKKNTSYSIIFKGLIVLTLFVSISLLNSCNKDEPDPPDPCENITCLNGGVCVNGDCDCADGYSGPSCADQITPDKIKISEIKITSYPQYDGNNETWDFGSGPDIYVVVGDWPSGDIIHVQPNYWENAEVGQTYTYSPTSPIILDDANAQYYVALFDWDSTSSDDNMGGIYFTPYSSTGGFPTTINLDVGNDAPVFELTVSYVW